MPVPGSIVWGRVMRAGLEGVTALAAATALVAAIDAALSIENASPIYLLAVTAMAIRWGTLAALATAIGAVGVYNFGFVEPRFTLLVGRAEELVTLVLLLFVGGVIGQLAGAQRDRGRAAEQREREARSLFVIARDLATAVSVSDALPGLVERLRVDAQMERVWIGIGPTVAQERVTADTGRPAPLPAVAAHAVLHRDRSEDDATWIRINPGPPTHRGAGPPSATHRVEIRDGGAVIGSIWAQRAAGGAMRVEETRLIAVTADQLGQALARERLAAAASELEIARRSDELKGALLDSASHDMRTPLAAIRAAAGTLSDPAISLGDADRRATAAAIDREAERLNRLVSNLLDMSRIRAGALHPRLELVPVEDVIDPAIDRCRPRLAGRGLTVEIGDRIPPLDVDPTLVDQVLTNVLDNAVTHTPPGTSIRVRATAQGDGVVTVMVEDDGPGVSSAMLGRLFERFTQVGSTSHGFGLGLAVARGMVEAMRGSIDASVSPMGGLAVSIRLPAGRVAMP